MGRLSGFLLGLLLAVALLGQLFWVRRASPQPAPPALAKLIIETRDGRQVGLEVELATDPEHWQRGLMFRRTLPENRGMLFIFPQTTGDPFWMKNTLIPLSIAFADQNGVILRILDMTPCKQDPCPSYYPGVAYRQALEVNRGWFRRHRVSPGDRWRLP